MSSRLNPRDYDLGELRDAVEEVSERDDECRGADHTDTGTSTDSGGGATQRADDGTVRREPTGATERGTDRSPESRRITPEERDERRHSAGDGVRRRTREQTTRPSVRERSGHSNRSDTRGGSPHEFESLSRLSQQGVERPYLGRLPDEYSAQLELFEWLEHLLSKAGTEGAADAIEYYESIGWLSEESRQHLEDFLVGLATAGSPDPCPLGVEDHRMSLRYIARLSHRLN